MPFDLIEKQVIFEGRRTRLEVHHLKNTETGKRHHREVVVHGGAVCIVPILGSGDDERVIFVKQTRYAVGEKLIELPAGTLEKNEPPMNCAGRELLEETGYLAGKLQPLGRFFTSPGILSEAMYAFVARDLEKKESKLEEGEDIELIELKYDDAIDLIKGGRVVDGKSIAALLMYDRFHHRTNA